jgi:glyoxylase-like metal-dependent hydrolase (beta-lactamase superfamily II)
MGGEVRSIMHVSGPVYAYSKDKPRSSILLRGFSCNVFAIDQGDEAWLVDAGCGLIDRPRRIARWMRADGLNPAKITRLFLTHAHPDHGGGIGYFSTQFGTEVCIHESEEPALAGGSRHLWESESIAARGKIRDFYPAPMWLVRSFARYSIGSTPRVGKARLLKDGDVVKGSKCDIVTIHTPGHVPGHACYYLPGHKAAFIGDLIDPSFDHKASLNFPSSDFDQMCQSIQAMARLDTEILCAAHAKDVMLGAGAIQELFAGTLAILNRARETTIDLLKRPGGIRLKDFAGHYPKETWLMQDQICVPFAVIKSLEKEGRIKAENGRYQLSETGIA